MLLAALALAGLSACGSATDATTFQPPASYKQVGQFGPFLTIWIGPDKQSSVFLMALPTQVKPEDAMKNADIHGSDVKEAKMIKICGSQDAYFADLIGTVNTPQTATHKQNQRIEVLATLLNGKTYVVAYSRPVQAAVDPQVDSAIKNICPKQ